MNYYNMVMVVRSIQELMADYIREAKLESLIIGVSGGIDSAVVCAIARPVCDGLGIKLIGKSIPISTNKSDEIERAKKVGEAFCHEFEEFELDGQYGHIRTKLMGTVQPETIEEKIRAGNIKARLRMILLYDVAQANKGMVLSTDNYTEYLLGFWTLHGDAGDYGPIQSLWKTEVYELANFMANECKGTIQCEALAICKNAIPTDGLGITNSDLDQLGVDSYDEVDRILKEYFDWVDFKKYNGLPYVKIENKDFMNRASKRIEELETNPIIQRHLRTHFKRNIPVNIKRKDIFGL